MGISPKNAQVRKEPLFMETSRNNAQMRKNSFYIEISRNNKESRRLNKQYLAAPKTFCLNSRSQKNESHLSATSVLSQQTKRMPYNTINSMEKLNCTDYVDLAECQNRF